MLKKKKDHRKSFQVAVSLKMVHILALPLRQSSSESSLHLQIDSVNQKITWLCILNIVWIDKAKPLNSEEEPSEEGRVSEEEKWNIKGHGNVKSCWWHISVWTLWPHVQDWKWTEDTHWQNTQVLERKTFTWVQPWQKNGKEVKYHNHIGSFNFQSPH